MTGVCGAYRFTEPFCYQFRADVYEATCLADGVNRNIFRCSLILACFFGIGTIMQRYDWLKPMILLLDSLIVIYIGVGLLRAKAQDLDEAVVPDSIAQTIATACVVTWFNPQAIIDGTMMLGAFRVTLPETQSLTFIAGVVTASCLWFTGLTLLISVFRDRLDAVFLRRVNIVCGGVIVFLRREAVVRLLGIGMRLEYQNRDVAVSCL